MIKNRHPAYAAIAKVFEKVYAKARRKKSISLSVRTSRSVREVERHALSKFQPPTTLGDVQKVEKAIWKNIDFFWSRISVFRQFGEVLQELRPNGRQNQLHRQILLQIDLFWGLCDQRSRKKYFFDAKRTIVIYGSSYKAAFDRFDRTVDWSIVSIDSIFEETQKMKMQLFGEFSQGSQDSFETDSNSNKSQDDGLNSPKSGIFCFCCFWAN